MFGDRETFKNDELRSFKNHFHRSTGNNCQATISEFGKLTGSLKPPEEHLIKQDNTLPIITKDLWGLLHVLSVHGCQILWFL